MFLIKHGRSPWEQKLKLYSHSGWEQEPIFRSKRNGTIQILRTLQTDQLPFPSRTGLYTNEKFLETESKLSRILTIEAKEKQGTNKTGGRTEPEHFRRQAAIFFNLHKNNRRGRPVKLEKRDWTTPPSKNSRKLISYKNEQLTMIRVKAHKKFQMKIRSRIISL